MKCIKCGGDTDIMVQVVVVAPGDLFHKFNKRMFRRSDVQMYAVLWETSNFICRNPKCGHVLSERKI